MRTLGAVAVISGVVWWILWELRMPAEAVMLSYDEPASVLARQAVAVVGVVAVLLMLVFALERRSREVIESTFRGTLLWVQVVTAALAGAAGSYAVRILIWMHKTIRGWPESRELTSVVYPVLGAAILPWALVLAVIILTVTMRRRTPAIVAALLVFDGLVVAVSYLLFRSVYSWACLSCSGPLG
jgi:hypothetical protein